MFRVWQNDKHADCYNYNVDVSWDNSLFKTKREAEVYAFMWAYPVSKQEAFMNAPQMETGIEHDYGMAAEAPVFMKITEES